MEQSNLVTVNLDQTTGYFNNFLKPGQNISQNVNDAIIGYFERIADTKAAARAMAAAVIATAAAQGIDAAEMLDSFKKLNQKELNEYIIKFLNYKRVETSYLGVNNKKIESKYIKRLIKP